MAFLAWLAEDIITNPNRRDLPVAGSIAMVTDLTWPKLSKA
jgi:hypothetical protein